MRAVVAVLILVAALVAVPKTASAAPAAGCDPIAADCLLPFPDNWFTVADPGTATHRRVAFTKAMMPQSRFGVPIDPAEYDRNDGFSPDSPILAHVPGLDLAKTGAAPITDIGSSLNAGAPIVIIDTATGKRVPYWAELDSNSVLNPTPQGLAPTPASDTSRQALIIHPAARLADGTHYVVALRNLRDAQGRTIPAGAGFAKLVGRHSPRARWTELAPALATLSRAGINGLYLAWDFTTSSSRSLTERALHMRDEAFAQLGTGVPGVVITSVKDSTPAQDPQIARRVSGYVLVPNFLNQIGGGPGSRLNYPTAHPGPDTLPSENPIPEPAAFQCNIPQAALAKPGRVVLFGHGLFQDQTVVDNPLLTSVSEHYDVIFCGAAWLGLTTQDIPYLSVMTLDLSNFPTVPDRMQQAYLDFLFLGRWMIHPKGLAASSAFSTGGRALADTSPGLTYAGYSLGGIEGGALTSLGQDWTRSWLGVPAMGFSTLLNRSSDFAQFKQLLDVTYPDPLEQQIGFGLIQMLWDRGEGDGYIDHVVRNPLPGTPVHRVLVQNVVNDHQVANVASQVEARSLGIPLQEPALAPGRDPDVTPFWGILAIPHYPYAGSAVSWWDSGSPQVPLGNLPPSAGHDPHDDVANTPAALDQAFQFLITGEVTNTCDAQPCTAIPTS
jgi:hypothetical protein